MLECAAMLPSSEVSCAHEYLSILVLSLYMMAAQPLVSYLSMLVELFSPNLLRLELIAPGTLTMEGVRTGWCRRWRAAC